MEENSTITIDKALVERLILLCLSVGWILRTAGYDETYKELQDVTSTILRLYPEARPKEVL